jgi:hypothetical protein
VSCCPRCVLQAELRRISHSPLLAAGGFGIFRGLFESDTLAHLTEEALSGPSRFDAFPSGQDFQNVRGGKPARHIISVEGRDRQSALFLSPELGAFVSERVNSPIRPCGERASYSIYSEEGAHLDIHRDVPGCDLALITCLHDNDPDADGGALDFWLDDLETPLSAIRASPETGRTRLPLHPGDSLLLHGGVVPHRIPATRAGRLRVVSLMCFEIV